LATRILTEGQSNDAAADFRVGIATVAVGIIISIKITFKIHYSDYYNAKELGFIVSMAMDLFVYTLFVAGAVMRSAEIVSSGKRHLLVLFACALLILPIVIPLFYWIIVELPGAPGIEKGGLILAVISVVLTVVLTEVFKMVFQTKG
jgi:hypothetical protein